MTHPNRARYKRLKSDVADSDADHFSIPGAVSYFGSSGKDLFLIASDTLVRLVLCGSW